VVKQVEKYFENEPNVQNIISILGVSFSGQGLNSAMLFVTLKDFSLRKNVDQSAQTIANTAMGTLMSTIPDANVLALVPPAISGLGNSNGFDFRLQDKASRGYSALLDAGNALIAATLSDPALSQVYLSVIGTGPQLSLKIDRQKAAALNVDFSDAASIISTAIGSEYAGKFPNMGRMQNIWIQADSEFRMSVEDILNLNTRNRSGEMVPLSSFVSMNWSTGPTQVARFNSYTSLSISGQAAPGRSSGQALTAMETLAKKLPNGFGYEWAGISYQEKLAGSQTTILLFMAMLTVFLILSALYESWVVPVAVMMMVPLGMLGAVALSSAVGLNNDVYFTVGMVTVIGLSAKNAILIVEFAKENYDQGMSLIESVTHAASQRFRPIVMTSFALILGIVPLVLASGAGAASQKAVGFGVLGGILAATPFAVFFVPVFFIVVLKLFRVSPKIKQQENIEPTAPEKRQQ
jgi:multidrug efflux pump